MSKKVTQRKKPNTNSVEVYTREIRKLDTDLREMKKQCDDLRKSNRKLSLDKEHLSKLLKKMRDDNEDVAVIEQYENEIKGLREKNKMTEDHIWRLEQKICGLETEKKRLKSMESMKDREIHNLHQEVRGLKEQNHELTLDGMRTERLKENSNEEFREVLKEMREEMKEFRQGVTGLKSEMVGLKVEMKCDLSGIKNEIVNEVAEVVRNEIGDRCESRVVNLNHLNISTHLPMTSWE